MLRQSPPIWPKLSAAMAQTNTRPRISSTVIAAAAVSDSPIPQAAIAASNEMQAMMTTADGSATNTSR